MIVPGWCGPRFTLLAFIGKVKVVIDSIPAGSRSFIGH
jgi:hypothetical protein